MLDFLIEGHLGDDVSFTLVKEHSKLFLKAHNKSDREAFFTSLPAGVLAATAISTRMTMRMTMAELSQTLVAANTSAVPTAQLSMKDLALLLNFDTEMINAGSCQETTGKEDTVRGHSRAELVETHIRLQLNPNLLQFNPNLSQFNPNLSQLNPSLVIPEPKSVTT